MLLPIFTGVSSKHNGRHQNSLPLTTNLSQKLTEPSEVIRYPVSDLCRRLTKPTGPCAYTLHSNLIPPTDGTNGLLSILSHTFHKQVTNVSQHIFVILLWGIITSPLRGIQEMEAFYNYSAKYPSSTHIQENYEFW